VPRASLFAVSLFFLCPLVLADTIIAFEGFPDGTVLAAQYSGLIFSNAVILSAGITLNEFEFAPHSGIAVASDNGGAMTITFASPVQAFSGYFTYSVPVTLQAFDSSNNQVATAVSRFSSNEAFSGVLGSRPNELLRATASRIARVVITGLSGGTSFTVDDISASAFSPCDVNQDAVVDVVDVQGVINEALGVTPSINDLNQDGTVNTVDIQLVMNAALGLGCGAS